MSDLIKKLRAYGTTLGKNAADEIERLTKENDELRKRIRMLETANGTYAGIEKELASLKAQLAEAQRDAARYRFIRRKNDWFDVYKINHMGNDVLISTAKLDAAIDKAMREGE